MKKLFAAFVLTVLLAIIALTQPSNHDQSSQTETNTAKNFNILLIVVDTLAQKHLVAPPQKMGKPHQRFLENFAAQGVQFTKAYAPAPWTKPSVASVMTGTTPSIHGMRDLKTTIRDDIPTMAELLKARGFKTTGVVSHTFLSPKTPFARGFDKYTLVPFKNDVHDSITSDEVSQFGISQIQKIRETDPNSPFFAFLHYFDPHFNYQHHQDFDRSSWYKGKLFPGISFRELRKLLPTFTADDISYLVDLYQEEISYLDQHLAHLMGYLKDSGLENNTLVILTADHGEEFVEHGNIGHGRSMYDEVLNVPLILSFPGVLTPATLSMPVSTSDLLPTILALRGENTTLPHWTGRSLTSLITNAESAPDALRAVFSEVDFHASKRSVVRGDYKLALDLPTKSYELYNLLVDPQEKKNLIESDPELFKEMAALLESFIKSSGADHTQVQPDAAPPEDATDEDLKRLESLGYLG